MSKTENSLIQPFPVFEMAFFHAYLIVHVHVIQND